MSINHTHKINSPLTGNGLATTRALVPGDLIISIPSPHLIIVEQSALSRICSYCMTEAAETSNLKRCTSCKIVNYCSPACQKADWKLVHKKECGVLGKLPGVPPTSVRALWQVLVRYGGLGERERGLESHENELRVDRRRWEDLTLQARAAIEFSKSSMSKMKDCMKLMSIVSFVPFI
jgi:hypothetical protein